MAGDETFVELAQYCSRTCHVLKTVTERRGSDGSSELVEKAIGSLERFVDPSQPVVIVTSGIRASRCINSNVFEPASGADCHPEHRPSSTEMSPSLCRAELLETLDTFYVCDHCLEVLRVLNPIRRARSQAVSSWLVNTNSTRGCLFPL